MAHGNTLPAKNDIGQPRVRHLNLNLTLEIDRDIPHVSLHLPKHKLKVVVMLVANSRVQRKLDVVMGIDSDDVRADIATGERHVLDDEVDGIIYKLDARDRVTANPQLHQHQHHSPRKNTQTTHASVGKITFLPSTSPA